MFEAKEKKERKQVVSDSESESQESSSSSGEDSDSSEDEQEAEAQNIEIPASVISRFFTNENSITNYLQSRSAETTHAMLDDLCSNYNLRNTTSEELTELAYILFECMKAQLA